MMQSREILVGRRGEAPLVPPYILPGLKKALALTKARLLANAAASECDSHVTHTNRRGSTAGRCCLP